MFGARARLKGIQGVQGRCRGILGIRGGMEKNMEATLLAIRLVFG